MSITRSRLGRRLAAGLAGALALGGLVALAPAAHAAQTGQPVAGSGVATWGLSDYLNSANMGRPNPKPAYFTAPSTFVPAEVGPPAVPALSTWGAGSGTVDAATGAATLTFQGTTVNWALTGNQWLTLSDLQATFDGTGAGSVSAVVEYGATAAGETEAARWAARTVTRPAQRVTIVDLSPTAEEGDATYPAALADLEYTFGATSTAYTWSGLKGRWSNDFTTYLVGSYDGPLPAPQTCAQTTTCWAYSSTVTNTVSSGVSRYPSAFSFSIARTVAATTASAALDGEGITIDVDGTGFAKTFPGVYVSLREVPAGGAPYAGGSVEPELATAWATNNPEEVGEGEQGAATAIADDGSFGLQLRLDAAAVAALDPAKTYTVVTRKAHGMGALPQHASQVTETPVALAALKQVTTTTATAAPVPVGTPATVDVAVAPAATGTPTGTVVLKNGDTTVGTAPLTDGAASIQVAGLPAGTATLTAQYSGSATYWHSAGTVDVTVSRTTPPTTLTGPASARYGTRPSFTYTVTGGTGEVQVTRNGAVVGSVPLVGGKATWRVPATWSVGKHNLAFRYPGSATLDEVTTPKVLTLTKAAARAGLGVVRRATAKKAGKVAVTVGAVTGGPTPVGRVVLVLKKGTVTKRVTRTLVGGKVVWNLPKVKAGTWKLTATYQGSTAHTSVARTWNLVVRKR